MPKDFGFSVLVFIAVCGFFVSSIWFSVFAKNTSGFSVLLFDVLFGFFYFVLFGFRFFLDLNNEHVQVQGKVTFFYTNVGRVALIF